MDHPSELDVLRQALRLYVGQHVLDRVLKLQEQAFGFDGEIVDASIMFTDVARFRPAADKFESGVLEQIVNSYLGVVTSSTATHRGVLDSFIGDAAISYWVGKGHAEQACQCARDVVAQLAHRAASNSSPSHPDITARIGVHSGKVRLGNYGSAERLRFTVLGAAVNLSSRLCALASGVYDHPIVVSEYTKASLPSSFAMSELASVQVKGLEEPVKLYGFGEV